MRYAGSGRSRSKRLESVWGLVCWGPKGGDHLLHPTPPTALYSSQNSLFPFPRQEATKWCTEMRLCAGRRVTRRLAVTPDGSSPECTQLPASASFPCHCPRRALQLLHHFYRYPFQMEGRTSKNSLTLASIISGTEWMCLPPKNIIDVLHKVCH